MNGTWAQKLVFVLVFARWPFQQYKFELIFKKIILNRLMLYSNPEVSFGDKPSTGWEYVLIVRAPSLSQIQEKNNSYGTNGSASARKKSRRRKKPNSRQAILERLRDAGISYSQLWVPSARIILIRLALPLETLLLVAEITGFELQLQSKFGGGYLSYKREREQCFVNAKYENYFTASQRLQLTLEVLGSTSDWGAGIDVEEMIVNDHIKDAYPVHDKKIKDKLYRGVVLKRLWDPSFRPNLSNLRDYFGTRVALYFAYLNFFTRMLIGISAISIPVHLLEMKYTVNDPEERYIRLIFVIVLTFWSAYFVKLWKRRNAILNVKWGSMEAEKDSHAEIRPQYNGNPRQGFYSKGGFVDLSDLDASNPDNSNASTDFTSNGEKETWIPDRITVKSLVRTFQKDLDFELGSLETGESLEDLPVFPFFEKKEQQRRVRIGWLMTALLSFIMINLTFLPTFYSRSITRRFSKYSFDEAVPGVLTAILIFISEQCWHQIYPSLVKWENHRRHQSYLDSLIIKRFSLDFTLNFCSLFYIAFIKPYTPDNPCVINPTDGKPDCFLELRYMLSSIVITKATLEHFIELGIPILLVAFNKILLWFSVRSHSREESLEARSMLLPTQFTGRDRTEDEEEFAESNLNSDSAEIDDFAELILQYAFVALFGVVYPLTPLLFYLSNLLECRTDAFKYLFVHNRPPATTGSSIGKWVSTMKFIMLAGIVTNAILLTFTGNRKLEYIQFVSNRRIASFFIIMTSLFILILLIDYAIGDVPSKVYRLKARQDYLIARYFGVGEKPHYKLNITGDTKMSNTEQEGADDDLVSLIRQ